MPARYERLASTVLPVEELLARFASRLDDEKERFAEDVDPRAVTMRLGKARARRSASTSAVRQRRRILLECEAYADLRTQHGFQKK